MLRRSKERVVRDLVERLRSSETLILADYRGLSMTEIDEVRTKLLAHGARFSVVKNTLTRRAAEEAGVKELVELLEGPTAIAFVQEGDMVAVAKTLSDTARDTKILTIKGGILQGQTMTAEQVRKGLLKYNGCVRGTNTPRCHTYPNKIARYVERDAKALCGGKGFYECITRPFMAGLLGRDIEG